LWAEASRRRVFRGAALYIVVAWLVVQIISVNVAPGEPLRRLAVTWAVGLFPLAVIFSWVFQVRPGRVDQEHKDGAAPPVTPLGRAFDIAAVTGTAGVAVVEAIRFATAGSF
jgi:hypothetical protein